MKKISVLFMVLTLVMTGCGLFEDGSKEGTVSLNLTDAPAFDDIKEIHIKISQITVSVQDGWETLVEFTEDDGSGEYNLLDFQQGRITPLAESVTIPAGTIGQIRFYLDAAEDTASASSSYVTMADDTRYDLIIPSADTSGLKLVTGFDVPVNGEVVITADFDARKSLIFKTDHFKMKPVIKLIVEGEAGHISGSVSTDFSAYTNVAVLAYKDGTWNDTELDFDPAAEKLPFMNSVSSSAVNDDGTYKVAYLAEGIYDLYLTGLNETTGFYDVIATLSDVLVQSGETTVEQNI